MSIKALVISGGGSRGAFAVGATNALKEYFPQNPFKILVGTSTGSLIVPMVALGRNDLLTKLYTTVRTSDVVLGGNMGARLLRDISLLDASPLKNLIERYYDNDSCNALFTLDKSVFIPTTCLQTSSTVVFSTKQPPPSRVNIVKMNNNPELRRAILASSNQPVFMQPVEVISGKVPTTQYVDGGVREYLGIQVAIDAGADEIFAISLSPPGEPHDGKTYTKAIDVLFRTIDMFSADVGTNDVELPMLYSSALTYINLVKEKMVAAGVNRTSVEAYFNIPRYEQFRRKPVKIHLLYPETPLGGGSGGLEFVPEEMKVMMQKGYTQMKRYLASLPPATGDNI